MSYNSRLFYPFSFRVEKNVLVFQGFKPYSKNSFLALAGAQGVTMSNVLCFVQSCKLSSLNFHANLDFPLKGNVHFWLRQER